MVSDQKCLSHVIPLCAFYRLATKAFDILSWLIKLALTIKIPEATAMVEFVW